MAVNLGNAFHYIVPLAFCLAGFHGVFFYTNLLGKAASWCLFQMGLISFLFLLAPQAGPVPSALSLLISAVTFAVGIVLTVFCLKLGRRHKTLDANEIAGRGSK